MSALAPVADRPDARLEARLLQQSARHFAKCLDAPDDVNVEQLLAAMRHFTKVLELKGSFTHFLVKEIHSNTLIRNVELQHQQMWPHLHTS